MQIEIHRLTSNHLYTEGQVTVNGVNFSHTIEHTFNMLPIGRYKIELKKLNCSHRAIAIIPQHASLTPDFVSIIEQGNSWITAQNIALKQSLTMSPIIIGTPLTPGVVRCSSEAYNRLFERLKKCRTEVTLIIRDNLCKPNLPNSHWVKRETRNLTFHSCN